MPSVIPDDVPVYRINDGGFYADDTLFQKGAIIAYEDEPNMEMEPLNKLALERMKKYVSKLDKLGREVAEKTGKGFVSYEDAFKNAYSMGIQDGKKVSLLNAPRETPIMGSQNKKSTVNKIADPAIGVNPARAFTRDDLNASDLV
jgi:hypothetical protein